MTHDTVTVYRDRNGEWRWRRRAANGETISDSAEGYTDRGDAVSMAHIINTSSIGRSVDFVIEDDE